MGIKTIPDAIEEAIKKAYPAIDKLEHDITCFNDTGTRCVAIYDEGRTCNNYLVIGLAVNPEGEWAKDFSKATEDCIVAMCEADAFLKNHD